MLFSENPERAWWECRLAAGMSHVDILLHCPVAAVLVESHGRRVRLTTLEPWVADRLVEDWSGRVISLERHESDPPGWPPIGLTTCVTLAKSIVGCFNPLVITPMALAKWCLAQGGTDLGCKRTEDHAGPAGA